MHTAIRFLLDPTIKRARPHRMSKDTKPHREERERSLPAAEYIFAGSEPFGPPTMVGLAPTTEGTKKPSASSTSAQERVARIDPHSERRFWPWPGEKKREENTRPLRPSLSLCVLVEDVRE